MNTFTWFLYLSGTVHKLGSILGVTAMIFGTVLAASPLICRTKEEFKKDLWPKLKILAIIWSCLLTLFVLLPDKETALMMGASEAVSRGSQTEVGSELQKTIIHQLKELRKESK